MTYLTFLIPVCPTFCNRFCLFLAQQWNLPSYMADAIDSHHEMISGCGNSPKDKLVNIVNLGNRLSRFRLCPGSASLSPNPDEISQVDKLSRSLGIGKETLAEIQGKTLTMLIKESEFLEIKIGSIIELLEAANSMIFKQFLLVEKLYNENREMQEQIAREKIKKAALESLQTITITLSHYINNASATIMGRAQMVQLGLSKGTISDADGTASYSMKKIIQSVKTISMVLDELKKMSGFDTQRYLSESSILDIEVRLKEHIEFMTVFDSKSE